MEYRLIIVVPDNFDLEDALDNTLNDIGLRCDLASEVERFCAELMERDFGRQAYSQIEARVVLPGEPAGVAK